MMPPCDQTGTPDGFDGFFHFNSSTTSGSACLISLRNRVSVAPRQPPISAIFSSIISIASLSKTERDHLQHSGQPRQLLREVGPDRVVDRDQRDRLAARIAPSEVEGGDID